jgi:cell division protein FtsB
VAGVTWIAVDPKGLRRYQRLGEEVSTLENENAALAARLDSLQRKAAALKRDPSTLERAARENGYVRHDEVLIELK